MRVGTFVGAIAIALFGVSIADGHPGGLDKSGCHNDRKNGGYHCHRSQTTSKPAPTRQPTKKQQADAKEMFRIVNNCPSTKKNKGPCPGWVADFVRPLRCGGEATVSNVRWYTTADSKARFTASCEDVAKAQ